MSGLCEPVMVPPPDVTVGDWDGHDEPCDHPDWHLSFAFDTEGPVIGPFGAHRMTPVCTSCGAPVQVGATALADRLRDEPHQYRPIGGPGARHPVCDDSCRCADCDLPKGDRVHREATA
jgi:hypothetical protein